MFSSLFYFRFEWVEFSPLARETSVQTQVESCQRLKKMVFDTALPNTQNYKVRIKGKEEQSKEKSSAPPHTTRCCS